MLLSVVAALGMLIGVQRQLMTAHVRHVTPVLCDVHLHNPTSSLEYHSVSLDDCDFCAHVYSVDNKVQCAMFMHGDTNKASHIIGDTSAMLLPFRFEDFHTLLCKAGVDCSELDDRDAFLMRSRPSITPTRVGRVVSTRNVTEPANNTQTEASRDTTGKVISTQDIRSEIASWHLEEEMDKERRL